jgi:hypothetical protein
LQLFLGSLQFDGDRQQLSAAKEGVADIGAVPDVRVGFA